MVALGHLNEDSLSPGEIPGIEDAMFDSTESQYALHLAHHVKLTVVLINATSVEEAFLIFECHF